MKKLVTLFTLVIVALVAVMPALAQGTLTLDTPVEAEAVGVPVQFTFSAEEGQAYLLGVVSPDFSAEVVIIDSANQVILTTDEGGENYNDVSAPFVAPATGDYTVTVKKGYGDPEGTFTVTLATLATTPLAVGETVSLDPTGTQEQYLTIAGTAGSYLNVYTTAVDDDVELSLLAPDGTVAGENDDDGADSNAYLRRVQLPVDGTYILLLKETYDSEMTAPVDITVEATESLVIGAEPVTFTLGTDVDIEYLDFEAGAGTYRLNVSTPSGNHSFAVSVKQVDEEYNGSSASFSDVQGASLLFVAVPGTNRIEVDFFLYSSDDPVDVTVSLETVE